MLIVLTVVAAIVWPSLLTTLGTNVELWLPVAADALRSRLGATVDVQVSTLVTDPWSRTLAPAPRRTP